MDACERSQFQCEQVSLLEIKDIDVIVRWSKKHVSELYY